MHVCLPILMLSALSTLCRCEQKIKDNGTQSSDSLQFSHKDDSALQSQQMLHTMTTVEMYRAQREVAHYLEMAYLQLADHPDVSKEVRLTAHASRAQHLMTSGLMKKFAVTAVDIVSRKLPLILDGIELQDTEIIRDVFSQIIVNAEQMKEEAEKTKESYYKIHGQVRNNIESVKSKNAFVQTETARLHTEMENEKSLAKASKLAQERLEKEKAIAEQELEHLKRNREQLLQSADEAGKTIHSDNNEFDFIGPFAGMAFGEMWKGIAGLATNLFRDIFGGRSKEKMYREMINAYRAADDSVYRTMSGNRELLDKIHEQRKDALERLGRLKLMAREQAGLGDIRSLQEAELHLGDVDKQFTRIIIYWENLAATLKYLRDDVANAEVFLKRLENAGHATKFRKSLARTEKNWHFFGKICKDYIEESDKEILNLYRFLSEPIDNMNAEEKRKRQAELIAQIEDDINSSLPSEEGHK